MTASLSTLCSDVLCPTAYSLSKVSLNFYLHILQHKLSFFTYFLFPLSLFAHHIPPPENQLRNLITEQWTSCFCLRKHLSIQTLRFILSCTSAIRPLIPFPTLSLSHLPSYTSPWSSSQLFHNFLEVLKGGV